MRVPAGAILAVLVAASLACHPSPSVPAAPDAPSDSRGSPDAPPDAGVAGVPVTVVIDHGTPTATLDSSFAGLSYEKGALSQPLFGSGDRAMVGLFQRLGPGVLRVGGNSVDRTTWTPSGAGLTAGQTARSDVDRLAGFARATGWRVIYGVSMVTATPAVAADEAAYAAGALGDHLLALEIGNEPDLYAKNGHRPATYTYADFRAEWETYAAAIRKRLPGAVLSGPASAYDVARYTVPFAANEAARIALLTQHYYLANGQDPGSTIDKLLAGDANLPAELARLDAAARGAHLASGFRLAEANSYYNGGSPNVSDSYASSLWVIEFLFALAAGGCNGVNLHGGGNGPGYTPIADQAGVVVGPRPEYYGVLLFDLAGPGRLVGATASGPAIALSVHAVDGADGSTAVVLVNKDPAQTLTATVDVARPVSAATQLALTGPALDSTSGLLLGGAAIGADGAWMPAPAPPVPTSGTTAIVTVLPASAVLLRARAK
jgi:hypothetical protein